MDVQGTQELIYWIVGILLTSVTAGILGIINVVRAGKLLPRDMKTADLTNTSKEITVVDQYRDLTERLTERVVKLQDSLEEERSLSASKLFLLQSQVDKNEESYINLNKEYYEIKIKIETQKRIIEEQTTIISEQNKRLDLQERKITDQQVEIEVLRCELEKAKKQNLKLVKQIKSGSIVELGLENIMTGDNTECNKEVNVKKIKSSSVVTKEEKNDGNKV